MKLKKIQNLQKLGAKRCVKATRDIQLYFHSKSVATVTAGVCVTVQGENHFGGRTSTRPPRTW